MVNERVNAILYFDKKVKGTLRELKSNLSVILINFGNCDAVVNSVCVN